MGARVCGGGGCAGVSDNRWAVRAEEARAVSDSDRAWAEERLARALESLEAAGDAKRTRAEAEVRIAEAMVAAAAP